MGPPLKAKFLSFYMRNIIPFLFVLHLISCGPSKKTDQEILAERISRIENGLQPNLQIEGDSVPQFNIEDRMRELGIPGVSIAVLHNGKIEWAKGYGTADSVENRLVTTETLFLAGSISKPVAATRAHQLAEQGVISLDSNVNLYLSSWKLPENEFTQTEKVTTRRMLNHTAGLTVWGFPGYDKGDTIPSVSEVLDGKGNTDSVRVYKKPGESWMYSGGGYTIMQLMITDLEGKTFPEIMKANVLDPLGMKNSTFENPLPSKYHSLAATGYRSNGKEVEGKWPIYPEMAAAGLWTTPSELILWAKEIQQIQQNQKDGLLKTGTVNEMLIPGMNDHGLGPVSNEHTFGHGGADEGFRANMVAWKNHPVAVVIMVNSDNGSIMQEILLSIAREYKLPGVEPSIRKVINKTVEERTPLVGIYKFPELGEATISIKDNGLEISAEWLEESFFLLPQNDSTYFNKKNGDNFTFVYEGEKVKKMKVFRFEGEKIK
ncbi:class A beta-lactamase-related serine hydrolase [Algoriphagus lacus]|uniref:Class A beta-lactamase-related serine hydrolase n=2 Tax=Algoriphagus lacus TaxID=2056311 RepID=A0A418PPP5_9BACT|nr:class A beta-lactamase-related serine hydrolase [Algoriphagus lacus]